MNKWKPINTISKRTFIQNKGRNIVSMMAIIMTTLMFTTLFTLAQSMDKNMVEMAFRQSGFDVQVSLKSVTEKQLKQLAEHPEIKEIGESIVLGLAQNEKLSGRQVEVRYGSDSYAKHSFAMPTIGQMPRDASEIALDSIILERLGIQKVLGQTVTLTWCTDTDGENLISNDFTLCGIWEGNQSSYASMAWVSKEYAEDLLAKNTAKVGQILGIRMAQLELYEDENIDGVMETVLADMGLSELAYQVNLAYSNELDAMAVQESIPLYLGMLLVFIAGFLIIYNIFQISVSAEIQFYGKLKTLGTTAKQIKKLLYTHANMLCIISIPVGLLLGWLLGVVLVPIMMGKNTDAAAISANPVIFIGSAVFAWLTVFISCKRPASMAGKVSPMEALRYEESGKYNKKNKKGGRKDATLAVMAWENLWRNKKRTITVICSLTLGLVLLSSFYAKNASFDMEKYLEGLTISDFTLMDTSEEDNMRGYNPAQTTLAKQLVEQIQLQEGVGGVGYLYSHQTDFELENETVQNINQFYTKDVLEDWKSYDSTGVEQLQTALKEQKAQAVIYGMEGIPLSVLTKEQYVLSGNFDANEFATGDYVLVIGPAIDSETKEQYSALPTPSVGSSVTLENKSYTVMAVVYPVPSIASGAKEQGSSDRFHMSFVLPSESFLSQWPDSNLRRLFVNVAPAYTEEMQELLEGYSSQTDNALIFTSRKTMQEQYEAETRSAAVMGNAISVIIALIGVLNFANAMITAIVSRKREFATIQSIGMTKKQLCRMLMNEGLYYAAFTLAVSYVLSTLAVGVGVRAMVEGGYTTFQFTLFPLIVCTPIILILAVCIPYLCFLNLEKKSIVERLRTD